MSIQLVMLSNHLILGCPLLFLPISKEYNQILRLYLKKCVGFPGGSDSKESAFSARDTGLKIPWRREWKPTPVFLPGEFHGQRILEGYSP